MRRKQLLLLLFFRFRYFRDLFSNSLLLVLLPGWQSYNQSECQQLMELLLSLEGVIRKKEVDSSLGYDLNNMSDVRKLLVDNPKALERPILVKDGRAVIGRPPENVLDLLD